MGDADPARRVVRFGSYEVDLRAGELRKKGFKIRLQEKPFQILAALLEHPGELVTREELRERLWSADTFVDFDGSLNAAVGKLREALGDSAENPRFVETLPRRGYRFIAPVQKHVSLPTVATDLGVAHSLSSPRLDPLLIEVPDLPSHPPPIATVSIDPGVSKESGTHNEPLDRSARGRWAAVFAVVAIAVVAYLLTNGSDDRDAGARPPTPPGRILLAVLPFDNYTGDPEQDYFVGGLTEEVIAQLGRLNPERLGVITRTSTENYKAGGKPIELMGEELGVDYVVEGSFRLENEQVRITVQLIDVRDRTHAWVEDYEKRLDSVLQLQTEVANLISRSLALKLLDRPEAPTRVSGTSNALAYEAYLTGRYFREQITESGFRKGIEYFERAIAEDPAFAQAYSGLAGCYCLLGGHGLEVELPGDVLPRARKEAEAALELSESIEEAHGVLGMISLKYDWDFEEAERHFRRATDLNPSYAQGFLWYSLYYEVTGQAGEAIAKARRARDLNPLSLAANMNLAQQYYRAGRHGEAVQQLEKVLELNPNFWGAHWILGDIHQEKGAYREAIAALSKAAFLSDNNPVSLGSLGFTYGRAGEEKLARAMLADLEELAEERYVSPFNQAIVYLGLGEKDKAMEKLEEGYRLRSRSMAWLNVDARLEPLRDDPRFQSLLQRIGFRQ